MAPQVAQLFLFPILLIASSKWSKPNRDVHAIKLLYEANASAKALAEAESTPAGKDMHKSLKLFHECDGDNDDKVSCEEAVTCFKTHGSDAADFADHHKLFVNGVTEMCEENQSSKLSLSRAKEILGLFDTNAASALILRTSTASKTSGARSLLASRREVNGNVGKVSKQSADEVLKTYDNDAYVERCVNAEIVKHEEEKGTEPNDAEIKVMRDECRKLATDAVESAGAGAFTKYAEWGKVAQH